MWQFILNKIIIFCFKINFFYIILKNLLFVFFVLLCFVCLSSTYMLFNLFFQREIPNHLNFSSTQDPIGSFYPNWISFLTKILAKKRYEIFFFKCMWFRIAKKRKPTVKRQGTLAKRRSPVRSIMLQILK